MTGGDPWVGIDPKLHPGEPLRVAVLTRRFPKLSETFILNQITGLLDAGVDVEVFAWTDGGDEPIHGEVGRYGLLSRTRYIQPPRSRIGRIGGTAMKLAKSRGVWRRPSLVLRALDVRRYGRRASSLALLYAAATLSRRGSHHLVHCQFGQLGLMALSLQEIGALPGRIVVAFRGADLTVSPDVKGYEALFTAGDLFLPVCEALRKRLIQMGCDPARTRVHRSGIDLARFNYRERSPSPDTGVHLLTIARLVEKKGVEYGIRAVARLKESGRKVTYTVVGDGPRRQELERLAVELDLRDRVRFTGALDQDAVGSALLDAHVLVAPSHTGKDGDQEGIPNALKEAMATGLPVVSTLHSGIPELVEDGVSGFLVPERDAAALADRLMFLADHPERWAAMGRAGRDRIEEEYDIRKLNHQLIELYRELLSGTVPPPTGPPCNSPPTWV
jgi:colanic acid/amylovoran biosynthesis glycosyltransferase